jgi:hypothetical protein
MSPFAFLAGLVLLHFPSLAVAEPVRCQVGTCDRAFTLQSVSATKSYALLLAAPEAGCRHVRFTVSSVSGGLLGQTTALSPGELGLVRIGRGFAAGPTDLVIAANGCKLPPTMVRRVTLAKTSPDHGARATRYAQ